MVFGLFGRTRWGQTLPFSWEPFHRIQSAGIITRYLHKGGHRAR